MMWSTSYHPLQTRKAQRWLLLLLLGQTAAMARTQCRSQLISMKVHRLLLLLLLLAAAAVAAGPSAQLAGAGPELTGARCMPD
jgi:hypothetical protein